MTPNSGLEMKVGASGKAYVKAITRVPKPQSDADLDAEILRSELANKASETF